MRLLLLWPWPRKDPNPSGGDDRVTCFWPQGNDPSSLAKSLAAQLNGGAFTHVMLHNTLGQADWDDQRGIECPHGIEEVVKELLPLIGEHARSTLQQIAIYGHFPDDEFLDRGLQQLRRRLWYTLSATLGREPAELRERVHMLDTKHVFRQPQGLAYGVYIGLYTTLVASLAKVLLNLGNVADNANHYFRKENIEIQEFLHRLDRMRYLPAKRALNRFGVGAISAFGGLGSRDEYLLDSPFRHYYRDINTFIETSPDQLSAVFHDARNGNYLDYAIALYDYTYDHETNRFILVDLLSSTDLEHQDARLIRLLPMLHSSVYYCKADTWQSLPDDRRKNKVAKEEMRSRFRLAFVIAALQSDTFKGTMNFSMFERQYDKTAPSFKELESSVEELLIPVLKAKVMATLVGALEKEAQRKAATAALSQVLARTLSHNLGSHSLNAFSGESAMLGQFQEIECRVRHKVPLPGRVCKQGTDTGGTQDASDDDQLPPDKSCIDVFKEYKPCNPQEEAEISRQRREWLATYNNYLRERMDFLADITTAVPAFETRTHLVQDLLKGYADNHLLTATIAGSPDFDYQWKPVIGEGKDDILVSIPSDVLGRHAFYVILENIVRNSAKHGGHKKCVTYTVEVKDGEGRHADLLKVTIKDDKPRICTKARIGENEYKGSVNELVDDRNENIKAEVLKDGRVRDGAWGMLEMKACAAYLRAIPLEELDEKKYHPRGDTTKPLRENDEAPLLEAVCDEEGHFGYSFYVCRPKRILFTGHAKEVLANEKEEKDLREAGFLIETVENLARGNEIYKHRLWCHVHTEANREELGELVKVLANDPARFPHQVLVIAADDPPVMDQVINTQCRERSALLSRTLRAVSKTEFDNSPDLAGQSWDDKLFIKSFGAWIRSSAQVDEYRYTKLGNDNPVLDYLPTGPLTHRAISADYADHGKGMQFYGGVWGIINEGRSGSPDKPIDIEAQLIAKRARSGKRLLLPFSSGVAHVMAPDRLRHDPDLALRHADYWLDDVIVIDERIQAAVHGSKYSLVSSTNEQVWVKHLCDLGSVWIPHFPSLIDLNAPAFDKSMWVDKLLHWIKNTKIDPAYIFVHLGILEKFKNCMEGCSIDNLLEQMKEARPATRIIIISGRGKPSGLPAECFVSYSAMAQYITQDTRRSAMLLHELARTARRITTKNA